MARMKACMAAVLVLEKEGITQAFGVPGAAINPLYAALRERQSIAHILARHVEAASHMAEGYTRARAGNIGVCIGTSGPAGTDMITGLYSAGADSIPILCITGPGAARAPVQGGLPGGGHRVHRQAGHQVGRDGARAGAGAARVPAGLPPDALGPARPRAGRPALRRADGRDRVRHRHLRAAAGVQAGGHAQAGREGAGHAGRGREAGDRGRRRHHQRRRERAAGGVRRAHRRAGDPHADGLGQHPRRPPAHGRHVRPADQPPLRQRHPARQRLRAGHRQPLGEPPHRLAGGVLQGPHLRARRHRADADRPRVHARLRHRERCQGRARPVRAGRARAPRRRPPAGLRRLGRALRRAQAPDAAQDALRPGADQAACACTRR